MRLINRNVLACFFVMISILILPTGCKDGSGKDNDIPIIPDSSSPSRSFAMGATPYRLQVTENTGWTIFDMNGFEGHLDIISLHTDNFFGLPWDEFAAGSTLPAPWLPAGLAFRIPFF